MILFGFLNLGSLLKYFPHPLIVGFTSGIALVIFSTQIKDALGLSIEKVPTYFIEKWSVYIHHFTRFNYWSVIITISTILLTIYSKKVFEKVPGSFIAIILITPLIQWFDIPVTTIEPYYGNIPNKISLGLPNLDLSMIPQYISPAITIALLGGIESLLSAVVSDGMISGKHRSNTELIAQGIANIVTPMFGGIPATGAIARTATNVKNGGRTPIAGMFHAITLLIIMLFFGQWAKLIPMSVLSRILIVVAYNMSEWRSFICILKSSTFDIIILVSTFLLTVLVDLTIAIEIGVVLSALLFMKRMSDIADKRINNMVDTDILEDYSTIPKGVNIYEISGPLFFASAKKYAEVIEKIGLKSKIIIIRMRHVSFIDQTRIKNLRNTILTVKKSGTTVLLSGISSEVMKDIIKYDIINIVGENHVHESFENAVIYANNNV